MGILYQFKFVVFICTVSRQKNATHYSCGRTLKNATVAFTQTIGDLYYQNGNFTNIILKKITFFLEFVRTRYYLETATLNEQFIDKLALKSSNSKEDTKAIIDYITYLKSKTAHTEQELIELNKK